MIRDRIKKAIQKASGEVEIELVKPEFAEQGDYATNIALKMGGRKVAEELAVKLKSDKDLVAIVSKIEVAGPGFINFWVDPIMLVKNIEQISDRSKKYRISGTGEGKTVLVEYSAPNIAKRFGIGHLRSTIIGDSLYRLHKALGYTVVGENHLGDWGTQFGVFLYKICEENKGIDLAKVTIDDLEKMYVDFNTEAENNKEIWEKAKEWFKKLESGDIQARKVWKKIRDISLLEFGKIYDLLGVKIDNAHGESFYEDKVAEVIDELQGKGISKKSEGALIVEFDAMPPAMALKSDGTTTYFTRDLAAIRYRLDKWNPDIFIYEVGSEQKLHFKQVFEAAKKLGWTKNKEFVHVAHGLFRFKDGKMSTRKGKTVRLEDVLDQAIYRATSLSDDSSKRADDPYFKPRTKKANSTKHLKSLEEAGDVGKKVGIGSIKYFDLLHSPTSDIVFDWNKIFLLEGNSAPYLQYTYARCRSILEKYGKKVSTNLEQFDMNKDEELVARALIHFEETVESAATNYSPNLLCNYLFTLAQSYNTFYSHNKIVNSGQTTEGGMAGNKESKLTKEVEELRVALSLATAEVLSNGLDLLGIQAPERM